MGHGVVLVKDEPCSSQPVSNYVILFVFLDLANGPTTAHRVTLMGRKGGVTTNPVFVTTNVPTKFR